MGNRRDFILAGSSGLVGMGAHAVAQAQGRLPQSSNPASQNGVAITDHGARPDRADNREAIEIAIEIALRDGRSLFVPPGTFRFSTIDLKANDSTDTRRLVMSGPGTLHSEYHGFAIDARNGPFYDLVIDGPAFESVPGKGTILFNGDRFRRLVIAPGTQIRNFDWVIQARDYLQSIRMIGAIVRGGAGAVIKAPMAFDCVFTHNIIEFVTDGFVIDGTNDPALSRCSINDNLIEGIGGKAVMLGACLATSVSGNYLENNTAADIRLDAGTAPHKGLRVQGNAIQLSEQARKEGRFAIVWGRSTALPTRAGGNYCNGNLHDTAGTSALIDMDGDHASGQLYRGYDPHSTTNAPIGRAMFSDGLVQNFTWFDRAITIDPHQTEIRFARKFSAPLEAQVLTFGPDSPQRAPSAFDRKAWSRGSIVFNAAPQRGGETAWVCVQPGSPGEWAALRNDG